MKERGILFSAAMVRAILAGTKTQTRRIVKPQPKHMPILANAYTAGADRSKDGNEWLDADCINPGVPMKTPFVAGMRLWVRETFARVNEGSPDQEIVWAADRRACFYDDTALVGAPYYLRSTFEPKKWTPSIFMPRWASRLTLEIESVRAERLKSISHLDCIAEGLPKGNHRQRAYWDLWDLINGKGASDANPWVWAITFRKL